MKEMETAVCTFQTDVTPMGCHVDDLSIFPKNKMSIESLKNKLNKDLIMKDLGKHWWFQSIELSWYEDAVGLG